MSIVLFGIMVFIPILLILVIIHEFGHYLTAKLFKVHVHEFGFGFFVPIYKFYSGKTVVRCEDLATLELLKTAYNNKTIVQIPTREDDNGNLVSAIQGSNNEQSVSANNSKILGFAKNVVSFVADADALIVEGKIKSIDGNKITIASMSWSINLIPLGGFVKLAGENNKNVPRSFKSVHQWKQSIILISGSMVNLLFPILILFMFFVLPSPVDKEVSYVIEYVEPDSYAQEVGFQANDKIVSINNVLVNAQSKYYLINESKQYVSTWIISRNGELVSIVTNPVAKYGIHIGVSSIDVIYESENPINAAKLTAIKTQEITLAISGEIRNWTTGESSPDFVGPVGMAAITSQMTSQAGIIGWGIILIVISVNLGIVNLLPIPALDGGRLMFVIIEWIRGGKQLPEKVEGIIHAISFAILIAVVVLVSANDIYRLLQ